MATIWTSERDAKLLVLILRSVSTSGSLYRSLSQEWAEDYPDEAYKPSARAVENRIAGLKKQAGGGTKGANSTSKPSKPVVIPSTPAKKRRHETPAKRGSAKRARVEHDSDDGIVDNTDDLEDSEIDLENVGPLRKTPSRSSKSAGLSYVEEDEGDSADPGSKAANATDAKPQAAPKAKPAMAKDVNEDDAEDEIVVASPVTTIARSKKSKPVHIKKEFDSDSSD